jgi:DNA repair protein SbcD/Mre11
MKRVKILQAGDLHFDTPFKDLNKKVSLISKEELLEVFSKIIELALINSVDILLLTGDIFDNLTVDKKTLFFIKNQIERIGDVRVFISPGNHDPYNEKSFYKIIEWPENVHVFKDNVESIKIEELKTVVWGAAFTSNYIRKSLLKNIRVEEEYINIMTIHGELSNSDEGNEYNPITKEDIGLSGLNYIAIGHRHNFSGIQKSNNTYYSYAGCPQGRGFDEAGDKGVILGDVSKETVNLQFIRTSKRNYYIKDIDITNTNSYEEIKNIILNEIDEEERNLNFYKIILKGEVESYFNINEEVVLEKIKDYFYFIKIIDNTKIKIDIDTIAKDYSIKGVYARKLLEKSKEDISEEIIELALKMGVQALSKEEVKLNDY